MTAPAKHTAHPGVLQRLKALLTPSRAPYGVSFEAGACGFDHGSSPRVDRLSSWLPWEACDEEGIVLLKGLLPDEPEGLGFTIELQPQTGVTDEIQKCLLGICPALPKGAVLTVSCFASSAVEAVTEPMLFPEPVKDSFAPLSPEIRGILQTAATLRRDMLLHGARHQLTPSAPVYPRTWRVWLSVVVPGNPLTDTTLTESVLSLRRTIASILEQSVLMGGFWSAHTLVGTAAELLNPQAVRARTFRRPTASPYESPSARVMQADTEITVARQRIVFESAESPEDKVHVVGLYQSSYPETGWSLAQATQLLGETSRAGAQIGCPFVYSAMLQKLDDVDERVKAETHRLRAVQMSRTPLAQLSPYYPEKARQWSAAVKSFDEAGLALVSHQMVLFTPPENEAEFVTAAQSVARKAGCELRRTTCLHALSLMAALPMAAGPLLAKDLRQAGRFEKRTAATALYGAPVMTEWRGTPARDGASMPSPLLTLIGRRGQIMHVDPFASNASYSMTIVGKPGSGKSVVMNALAVSVLGQNGLVWIFDVGRSYEKIAGVFEGDFLAFDPAHVWDLNPLALADKLAETECVESIAAIIAELISLGTPLQDLQKAVLVSSVATVVANARRDGRKALLSDLHAELGRRAAGDRRIEDLRLQLAPYITGPLAVWFDGSGKPVTFEKRLTVLELEGLNAHPALRQAALMTLMLHIEHTMAKDRATVKLVLIDEAWDLMGAGHAGSFIASGFRRARKHRGSFVVATQSIADYFRSETAEAAWACADCRLYLRQDAEVLTNLESQGKLAADPWLSATLPGLTTVRGAWSEMIVKIGDAPPAVGRLVLDRFTQVLFSSLPSEVVTVNAWRAAGKSMAEAVRLTAEGRRPE